MSREEAFPGDVDLDVTQGAWQDDDSSPPASGALDVGRDFRIVDRTSPAIDLRANGDLRNLRPYLHACKKRGEEKRRDTYPLHENLLPKTESIENVQEIRSAAG